MPAKKERIRILTVKYYRDRYRESSKNAWAVILAILMAIGLILLALCLPAHAEYSDSEIVAAIYLAEGGPKAEYPFGIRSVTCDSKEKCKRICDFYK